MEIKGYTYGYGAVKGTYKSERAARSREALMETGINWVCLAFSVKQKTYSSTEIFFDFRRSVPDLEVISTIEHFHKNNVKVCLKPMIDTEDGVWLVSIMHKSGVRFLAFLPIFISQTSWYYLGTVIHHCVY